MVEESVEEEDVNDDDVNDDVDDEAEDGCEMDVDSLMALAESLESIDIADSEEIGCCEEEMPERRFNPTGSDRSGKTVSAPVFVF